jgi:hypothetical protein
MAMGERWFGTSPHEGVKVLGDHVHARGAPVILWMKRAIIWLSNL